MNPFFYLSILGNLRELKYFLGVIFIVVFVLPIFSIQMLTQIGSEVVSDTLIKKTEGIVQIFTPTGELLKDLPDVFVWPTVGVVTQEFGLFHPGLDIAGDKGDEVKVFMGGVVKGVYSTKGGYGRHVVVDHGNDVYSLYAHLNKITVFEGQEIPGGYKVGEQGNSGNTHPIGGGDGTHLHFEVKRVGGHIPVNPRVFFQ